MKNVVILLTVLLLSCSGSDSEKVGELSFTTRDDSELFFKNIRQSNYDLQEEKEAKLNLFRHRDRDEEAALNLVLAHNWANDMAFLMLEWNDSLSTVGSIVLINTENTFEWTYEGGSVRLQTEFVRDIYNAMIDGNEILLSNAETSEPLFKNAEEKEIFDIVMKDYFRLTGLL